MKTIISLVVLISSISFAQTLQSKSLIELKQQSTFSYQHSDLEIQNPKFKIQNIELEFRSPESEKKNPALAILYSMLLPGMGELYAGDYSSGKYFTIADGALWGAFAGFEIYGKWKENDYKSFAESKGGVNLSGKEAEYFANIGIYQSIDDYNAAMELNRDFDKTYNTAAYYWKWGDNDQRKEYRDLWSSSESAFTNVRFVVGALILNRLISAVNAVRLVSAYNKNLSQEVTWNVSVGLNENPTLPTSITFNFVKSF